MTILRNVSARVMQFEGAALKRRLGMNAKTRGRKVSQMKKPPQSFNFRLITAQVFSLHVS